MTPQYYSNERSVQIVISVLKANGIKRVIASPGTTNVTFVGSLQNDPWFEIYSAPEERSAAYMACGLAAETGEPVVITCTGATASRDYLPGLTEAYYRKLPVLAITANQGRENIGNLVPQNIDRRVLPNDVAKMSVYIPATKDSADEWHNTLLVNTAVLELFHHGGGPVHIDLTSTYSGDFSVKELPATRIIHRYMPYDDLPDFPEGRIAIFIGSHKKFTAEETRAIDMFCATFDAVVICDHTSGYNGQYAVNFSLVGSQVYSHSSLADIRVLIHIGEVSGDYYGMALNPQEVWRVSEDGELRDKFRKLSKVFEMRDVDFFSKYAKPGLNKSSHLKGYKDAYKDCLDKLPELPFSNAWIAQQLSREMPDGCVCHFGILNSLRSWNWFNIKNNIDTNSNVGGFGIDGSLSTIIGASLANPKKLYFICLGDLAFFYDMNALGNRHIGKNVRILLVNNGVGSEFKLYSHPCYQWGEKANDYMAAAGHYGNKNSELVKNYAENLGFKYITASSKEDFNSVYHEFLDTSNSESPIVFEVFTNKEDESFAQETILKLIAPQSMKWANKIKEVMPESVVQIAHKLLRR